MSYDDRYDDRYDDGYDSRSNDSYGARRDQRGGGTGGRRMELRDDRYERGYGDEDDSYFDEYDDVDDSYGSPRPISGTVGDAEHLIKRVIDIVINAPTVPLSTSRRVDGDELIELLDEAVARLPDELREARWMLKERQEFIAKTKRERDEMLEAARVQAERMVQRTEVVRAAEARARQVKETSEDDARRLKLETEDFLDQRLASFEILLDKLGKTVATGRRKLSIGDGSMLQHEVEPEDEAANVFFDQDR